MSACSFMAVRGGFSSVSKRDIGCMGLLRCDTTRGRAYGLSKPEQPECQFNAAIWWCCGGPRFRRAILLNVVTGRTMKGESEPPFALGSFGRSVQQARRLILPGFLDQYGA